MRGLSRWEEGEIGTCACGRACNVLWGTAGWGGVSGCGGHCGQGQHQARGLSLRVVEADWIGLVAQHHVHEPHDAHRKSIDDGMLAPASTKNSGRRTT